MMMVIITILLVIIIAIITVVIIRRAFVFCTYNLVIDVIVLLKTACLPAKG